MNAAAILSRSVKNWLGAKAALGGLSLTKVLHFVHNEILDPGQLPWHPISQYRGF